MHKTILIVDDDVTVRHFLGSILRRVGYRVIEHTSAEDALITLQALDTALLPSMVFTDLRMPGMNGDELIRAILKLGGAIARIPCVLVSGTNSLLLGVEFIPKPFTAATIVALARQHCYAV